MQVWTPEAAQSIFHFSFRKKGFNKMRSTGGGQKQNQNSQKNPYSQSTNKKPIHTRHAKMLTMNPEQNTPQFSEKESTYILQVVIVLRLKSVCNKCV